MTAVFYHDERQHQLALQTRDREAVKRHGAITTQVLPATEFWPAEDYHQKYMLQHNRVLMRDFQAMYPQMRDLVNSTAAARINGYLGGNGSRTLLDREIADYGLSKEGNQALLESAQRLPEPLGCRDGVCGVKR